jgi:hypothetical protein
MPDLMPTIKLRDLMQTLVIIPTLPGKMAFAGNGQNDSHADNG